MLKLKKAKHFILSDSNQLCTHLLTKGVDKRRTDGGPRTADRGRRTADRSRYGIYGPRSGYGFLRTACQQIRIENFEKPYNNMH